MLLSKSVVEFVIFTLSVPSGFIRKISTPLGSSTSVKHILFPSGDHAGKLPEVMIV